MRTPTVEIRVGGHEHRTDVLFREVRENRIEVGGLGSRHEQILAECACRRLGVFYIGFLIGIAHIDEQRKPARAGQQFADDFEPFWDQRRAHDRHARHIAIVSVA